MGAQLRVLRRRIRSVESTKKITRAQELIATSRITKAQQRVQAALPYTRALIGALEAAAANARLDNPLLESAAGARRSAVLVVTSDRGFAGAYSANVIRQAESLSGLLLSSRATSETTPDLSSRAPSTFHNGPQRAQVTLPALRYATTRTRSSGATARCRRRRRYSAHVAGTSTT